MNESETIMFISLKLKANPPATVPSGRGGGGGVYSLIKAMYVCASPNGAVWAVCPFCCGIGYGGMFEDICPFNSR